MSIKPQTGSMVGARRHRREGRRALVVGIDDERLARGLPADYLMAVQAFDCPDDPASPWLAVVGPMVNDARIERAAATLAERYAVTAAKVREVRDRQRAPH